MKDLMQIIQWREEISELEYQVAKLELIEENYAQKEEYEKAQLVLMEQKRMKRRIKHLNNKMNEG